MWKREKCQQYPSCRKANGNCPDLGDDGLAVQCVGTWVQEKHDYLSRYIEATRAVRAKFLTSGVGRSAGGAAFVDLFGGPGRARIRETGELIETSPIIALGHKEAPFTVAVIADIDDENVGVLRARSAPFAERARVIAGDCNARIDEIIAAIPKHGLNIALVDPYGLRPLNWATLSKLAAVKRMDIITHFPTGDLKRNFGNNGEFIDHFLGTDRWRSSITKSREVVRLIDILHEQLGTFGYQQDGVRSLAVKNTKGGILYHLVYATKDRLGEKIWNSIAATSPRGQRSWNF